MSVSDSRYFGKILEAYDLGRILERSERLGKPPTISLLNPGYFWVEDTM